MSVVGYGGVDVLRMQARVDFIFIARGMVINLWTRIVGLTLRRSFSEMIDKINVAYHHLHKFGFYQLF